MHKLRAVFFFIVFSLIILNEIVNEVVACIKSERVTVAYIDGYLP